MDAKGCVRRLVLQQTEKADGGEYSCEAGGQSVFFHVDVTGECQAGPKRQVLDQSRLITSLRVCACPAGVGAPMLFSAIILHPSAAVGSTLSV